MSDYSNIVIVSISALDVRFPTSKTSEGTDSVHTNCNYSAGYLALQAQDKSDPQRHIPTARGIIFTIGSGNELCCQCVDLLKYIIIGKNLQDILDNFSLYWRKLTNEPQLRWIGPEKGVVHLAVSGIVNAIWDLYGKLEQKPLWKLLTDIPPAKLVNMIDFRYIEDVLTKEQALEILNQIYETRQKRVDQLKSDGYPAYTTACAWAGYSDQTVERLCKECVDMGFDAFKVKVGLGLEADKKRLQLMRQFVGEKAILMVDANQIWTVQESIDTMKELAQFNLYWIEEPTNPDDAWGHSLIAKEMNQLGIRVATGEKAQNRIIHKHFMVLNGYQTVQLDSAILGGVNEAVLVCIMAKKFNKPVCFHAGGVGLCEMMIHLQMFDYIGISGSLEDRWCEYSGALHTHFETPISIKNGKYNAPTAYGYGIDIKQQSLEEFKYPDGTFWINEIQPEVSTGRESGIDYTPTFSPKMNFKSFCGIMAAAFTCYDNESCKEINYKIIDQYAKILVQQQVNGVYLNGTAGESFSLTVAERKKVLEAWMSTSEVKNGILQVIVHSTCQSYPDTMEIVRHAQSQGVHGVAIMSPSYFVPGNFQQLSKILSDVAKQVPDLPVFYEHIPKMNRVSFSVKKTLDLANQLSPNIVGCHFTGDDFADIGLCAGSGYNVLVGQDTQLLSGLMAGAQGAIGMCYNILGNLHRSIYENFKKKQIKEAQRIQAQSRQIIGKIVSTNAPENTVRALTCDWYDLYIGVSLRWPQQNLGLDQIELFVLQINDCELDTQEHKNGSRLKRKSLIRAIGEEPGIQKKIK